MELAGVHGCKLHACAYTGVLSRVGAEALRVCHCFFNRIVGELMGLTAVTSVHVLPYHMQD